MTEERRIPKEFYGIPINLKADTPKGKMRVTIGEYTSGDVRTCYEQEAEESDEDFVFVIKSVCEKRAIANKKLERANRITRDDLEDLGDEETQTDISSVVPAAVGTAPPLHPFTLLFFLTTIGLLIYILTTGN